MTGSLFNAVFFFCHFLPYLAFNILWYKGKRKSESYKRMSNARRFKIGRIRTFLISFNFPYDVAFKSAKTRGGRKLKNFARDSDSLVFTRS